MEDDLLPRGFSAPFADWVIEGWEKHSKAVGGPEIVKRFRETLANPEKTKARAFSKTKRKQRK